MKAHLTSLGCKLNQAEIDDLSRSLADRGWSLVDAADADVIVLNSCAVTAEAERKSRQAIRRLVATNPSARLVVTGCFAELSPDAARACGAERVVGNLGKATLASLLASMAGDAMPSLSPAPRRRTRAMIRIQDGCDNACTYCIVHVARGRSRSRPLADVVAEVQARVSQGFQEVVLTGVNIGAYGRDTRGPSLGDLTAELLARTGIARLRWSSVEPWDVQPSWLALWGERRLCPHLHLPLQSGSDDVLARMGRPYGSDDFRSLVSAARAAIPDLAITTDIITGFPGETDADHETTLRFVAEVRFARSHVFPFSPRPGTPAAGMRDPVPSAIRSARASTLRRLSLADDFSFREQFIGRTLDVLWEARQGAGYSGLTANYLRVETSRGSDLWNRILPASLLAVTPRGLAGEVMTRDSASEPHDGA